MTRRDWSDLGFGLCVLFGWLAIAKFIGIGEAILAFLITQKLYPTKGLRGRNDGP